MFYHYIYCWAILQGGRSSWAGQFIPSLGEKLTHNPTLSIWLSHTNIFNPRLILKKPRTSKIDFKYNLQPSFFFPLLPTAPIEISASHGIPSASHRRVVGESGMTPHPLLATTLDFGIWHLQPQPEAIDQQPAVWRWQNRSVIKPIKPIPKFKRFLENFGHVVMISTTILCLDI